MATDVFSREVSYGGAFSADGTAVTFANFGAGLLAQHIKYSYQQQITRLYEVGSAAVYLVAGRTQGRVEMSRVLGPTAILPAFYAQFGNVCLASGNNLSFKATTGCGSASSGTVQTIGIFYSVIDRISGSVASKDMVINESLSLLFLLMTIN